MPPLAAHLHQWFGFRFIGLILGAAALVASAQAAERRVALVIGNAKYQQDTILRNPTNDARLLLRTLKDQPLKFDEVLILENGTRSQMLQQLARFGKLAQGADVAVLYYSGHGMINGKRQNFVLPVDMPKISNNAGLDTDAALKSYGVSETELIEAVEGAKVQVVVLDACRDNGFGDQKSGTKGLARRPDQSKNRLIAYATEEGRTAEDGEGHNSTYAQSLAKHLVRTNLPLLTVFDEVANDVEHQTGNMQSPTRSGNLRTSVYLLASLVPMPVVPPPEPGPNAAQVEQQAWTAAQRANSAAAYNAYLAEYPNGRYAAAARVALAAVEPPPRPMEPSPQTQLGSPAPGTRSQKQPPQQCEKPAVTGCWELMVINTLYDPGHPLMKGLDQSAATAEIRQERAQFLGPRLWEAHHAGTVKQAQPRSFVVMMWNVNPAVPDALITGFKSDMAKEKVIRTVPENVTGKIAPPKSEGLGQPERAYRIYADGISTSLQFSWELVTDRTVIVVRAEDTSGVYPNTVTLNQGHRITSESLTWLRNKGSVRGLMPFVSTQ